MLLRRIQAFCRCQHRATSCLCQTQAVYEYCSTNATTDKLMYKMTHYHCIPLSTIIVTRFSVKKSVRYNTVLDLLVPKVVVTTNQG
jgi:hypothetical protein